jgi:hypothetical protein
MSGVAYAPNGERWLDPYVGSSEAHRLTLEFKKPEAA